MVVAKLAAIPEDLATSLAPSAGLRDVLVHDYAEVDISKLVQAIALARRDFRMYIAAVADWLPR